MINVITLDTYSKVGEFEVVVTTRDQQIRRFQVRMNDTFLVDDIQSEADLNKELPRAHFADFDQTVMRGNVHM